MTYLDALQDALSAEHAAVYVIAALGAQTSASETPQLYDALTDTYAEHRQARDRLVELVRSQNGVPAVAQTAYALPADLSRLTVIEQRALEVERSVAAVYAALVASATGTDRRWPVERLKMTAVRALAFRGTPEMFPGSDEYADR